MEDPAFIRSLSETHRWLMFLLPMILLITTMLIQWVYGDRIGDKHASDYRRAISFCVAMSVLALVIFGIESF